MTTYNAYNLFKNQLLRKSNGKPYKHYFSLRRFLQSQGFQPNFNTETKRVEYTITDDDIKKIGLTLYEHETTTQKVRRPTTSN